jgi:hypothetical protein
MSSRSVSYDAQRWLPDQIPSPVGWLLVSPRVGRTVVVRAHEHGEIRMAGECRGDCAYSPWLDTDVGIDEQEDLPLRDLSSSVARNCVEVDEIVDSAATRYSLRLGRLGR